MERLQNVIHPFAQAYSKGRELYKVLEEKRPIDADVLICPMHIGDTLWIACWGDAYKKHHGCKNLLFVVNSAQETLPGLFTSTDGVIPVSPDDMMSLRIFIGFNKLWNNSHIRYAHWLYEIAISSEGCVFWEDASTEHVHDYMNMTRCDMLDIPRDSEKSVASSPARVQPGESLYGNAIMLMPMARTQAQLLPMSVWEKLAERLKNKGYDVYCNYNGLPDEIMIKGTKPLASSLMKMYELSTQFRRFVGLRSGICDLLAFGNAPITVIHPRYDDIPTMDIPYGAPLNDHINQVFDSSGFQTLQYREEWEDELISEIIKKISTGT